MEIAKNGTLCIKQTCLECKVGGKDVNYYGESGRSAFERGKEHRQDYENLAMDSHMLKHHVMDHSNKEDKVKFTMKVIKIQRAQDCLRQAGSYRDE